MRLKQRQGLRRHLAEAVDQLFLQLTQLVFGVGVGQALVERQALLHVGAVSAGQQGGAVQVDFGHHIQRLGEVWLASGLQVAHRALEHLGVQREADLLNLARLVFAQHLAGPANLQVVHGEEEARAEVFHLRDGFEPLLRQRRRLGVRVGQQVGISLVVRAPDPAAQLVELRQAEAVGAVHDDGVGGRDVDAGFDNGGAQQQVGTLLGEVAHHALQLALGQLAVADHDARLGQQLGERLAHVLDGVDFVVQKVHLPAALELAQHRLADDALAPALHKGLDRQPLLRRRGNHRKLAQPLQRQPQRARDWRGGEGEDVHLGAQLLERLFLAYAEAVLFVDDHQPQALVLHVFLQQAVGADDDVHLAFVQLLERLSLLFGALEARQLGDLDRPVGKAVGKGLVMLLGQQRGRAQHHHLFAIGHGNEGRAQGDLGFAKAHVAAHQPVHRPAGLHVLDHRVDGGLLIGGFFKAEGLGKGVEVMRLEAELVAGARRALGIQRQQLGGGVAYLLRGLFLGLVPLAGAQPMQVDRLGVGAGVAGDHMQLRDRHIQLVAARVFQMQKLGIAFAQVHVHQAKVTPHAVRHMHHRVANFQLRQIPQPALDGGLAPAVAAALGA